MFTMDYMLDYPQAKVAPLRLTFSFSEHDAVVWVFLQ